LLRKVLAWNHCTCIDVGEAESMEALKCMGEMIEDLGVCPLPDADVDSRFVCIHFIFVM
jgi:hypothetical protein